MTAASVICALIAFKSLEKTQAEKQLNRGAGAYHRRRSQGIRHHHVSVGTDNVATAALLKDPSLM